jgi:hypothetical protein
MPGPPPPVALRKTVKPESKVAVIAGAAGAVVMLIGIIGSALPWATASLLGFSKSIGGLSGDGIITIVCTLFALGFFVIGIINRAKWPFIITVVLALATAAVGIYDAATLSSLVSVGIGLIMVIISGLLGLTAGVIGIVAPRQ